MRLRTKIAILLVAILLSLLQFNFILCSSCAVDMLQTGKKAGYKMISNMLAEEAKLDAVEKSARI